MPCFTHSLGALSALKLGSVFSSRGSLEMASGSPVDRAQMLKHLLCKDPGIDYRPRTWPKKQISQTMTEKEAKERGEEDEEEREVKDINILVLGRNQDWTDSLANCKLASQQPQSQGLHRGHCKLASQKPQSQRLHRGH